jgi:Holliday junction resolvase-like predicted endonuclease
VKARTTLDYGSPAEAVGRAKQIRLRRLAGRYLSERSLSVGQGTVSQRTPSAGDATRPPVGIRFDVVSVLAGQVEVIEAAF